MSDPRMRSTDPEDSKEYAKRRIAMHPDGPPLAVNGWMARVRFVSLLVKDLSGGGLAIVLLAIFLGWLGGYVPLPIVDNFLAKLLSNDEAIMRTLGRVESTLIETRLRQDRMISVLVTATKVACENSARDDYARRNCLNIRE